MKKNKLSNFPSNDSSPILSRKSANDLNNKPSSETFSSDSDISKETVIHSSPGKNSLKSITMDNNYETIDKRRNRSNSYDNKDPGYETIPGGDKSNKKPSIEMNKSFVDFTGTNLAMDASILAQGIQRVSKNTIDIFHEVEKYSTEPGYESLPSVVVPSTSVNRSSLDYDPNYEILRPNGGGGVDDDDLSGGYSTVTENSIVVNNDDHGYSSIQDKPKKNHDYASIKETTMVNVVSNDTSNGVCSTTNDDGSDIYSSIQNPSDINKLELIDVNQTTTTVITTPSTDDSNCSDMTPMSQSRQLLTGHNYESLTESESDPNYDSVKYLGSKENPYEILHNEKSVSPEQLATMMTVSPTTTTVTTTKTSNEPNVEVGDYFQV